VPTLDSVTLSTLELYFLTLPKLRLSGESCTVPVETLIEAVSDFVVSVTDVVLAGASRMCRGLTGRGGIRGARCARL